MSVHNGTPAPSWMFRSEWGTDVLVPVVDWNGSLSFNIQFDADIGGPGSTSFFGFQFDFTGISDETGFIPIYFSLVSGLNGPVLEDTAPYWKAEPGSLGGGMTLDVYVSPGPDNPSGRPNENIYLVRVVLSAFGFYTGNAWSADMTFQVLSNNPEFPFYGPGPLYSGPPNYNAGTMTFNIMNATNFLTGSWSFSESASDGGILPGFWTGFIRSYEDPAL